MTEEKIVNKKTSTAAGIGAALALIVEYAAQVLWPFLEKFIEGLG